MFRIIFPFLFFLFSINFLYSQNTFKAVIKDSITNETIVGVTAVVKGTTNGTSSDSKGEIIISNIPNGEVIIVFTSVGYKKLENKFTFPDSINLLFTILLSSDEIIIEATRGNKTIENIPTRVEVLTEEIDEASIMDPSKIVIYCLKAVLHFCNF